MLASQWHDLKGQKEQLFSEVLSGLELRCLPCLALRPNQVYHLTGALEYNLMAVIKPLGLSDECQVLRLNTLLRNPVHLAGRPSQRSRQWIARVMAPRAWLSWWQRCVERVWPEYGPARRRVAAPVW